MTKYIFVTGGVISGIGKGVISASTAAILKASGVSRITIKKLDPYLNVDPGTMNPLEHGEVFVTRDGNETDLDLGYYERFTGEQMGRLNSTSSGRIYRILLDRERDGEFLGKTVQIIPHFTNEIKKFIRDGESDYDVIICEIGGSIGDIEAMAFYETLRQLRNEMPESVMFIHVTYLVYYETTDELKTKPTQNAIKELNSSGIYPDFLVCRTEKDDMYTSDIADKLALFTSVPKDRIILSPNVQSIYEVPLRLFNQQFDQKMIKKLGIGTKANMDIWLNLNDRINRSLQSGYEIKVGIIGKYVELHDAYKSLIESISHAAYWIGHKPKLIWIDCRTNQDQMMDLTQLEEIQCFIVPGGFGETGIEVMLEYIRMVRELKKPLLGICLGMQMICVEYARNVCGLDKEITGSAEMGDYEHQIVKVMIDDKRLGGTMRLGSYPFNLIDSKVKSIYAKHDFPLIERHRHRYDVNPEYAQTLENNGLKIAGTSEDGLVEVVELPDHDFYVGCQYHPEFESNPMRPHPLFIELMTS